MDTINKAVITYGSHRQTLKAIEELNELSYALLKDLDGRPDLDNIAEEIADVEIMIAQLKVIYLNNDRVEEWKTEKLERLEHRLAGCEYCKHTFRCTLTKTYSYCDQWEPESLVK